MAHNPRLKKNTVRSNSSGKLYIEVLTHWEVLDEAIRRLTEGIDLSRPEGAQYGDEDLWGVLLYAAAHQTTVEQACRALDETPHSNTVRGAVTVLPLSQLEPAVNSVLTDTWPRNLLQSPLEVAIDLKLIPYYGEAKSGEEDFLLSGPAKQGTTTFFGYASIYVIKKNKRFTLALAAVRRSEGLVGVLQRLLQRFADLGGRIRCLYLDRQFYSVKNLRFLIEERDIPLAMAARKTGKTGGIKGLVAQKGPGQHPYTVRSQQDGEIDVQIAVVGKYLDGRWGKHGRERYAYVVHRFPFALASLFDKYRRRFGIESSHRLWDEARARTASRCVALRWLLVGLAVLLYNLWMFLKWHVVSWPRRGGRRVFHELFPFRQLLSFLTKALEELFGTVRCVAIPLPPDLRGPL